MGGRISWLWQLTGLAVPKDNRLRPLLRARYFPRVIRASAALEPLRKASPQSLLGRMLSDRPQFMIFFDAPYLNAGWEPNERIARLVRHVEFNEAVDQLSFSVLDSVELMDLEAVGEGYHLVLDKPVWFHREGTLALNLFRGNVRLFTLAFSLERDGEETVALIGGIQGRNLPNILDTYRNVTKAAYGLRPRDLVIEAFRQLCAVLNVSRVLAVSDAARHHRSRYFGSDTMRSLPLDYDEIWLDRGGELIDGGFFTLPLKTQHRPQADIPAKKRAMYRKRYELLNQMTARLAEVWPHLTAVRRPEAD